MTRREQLAAMSDEELANWLYSLQQGNPNCEYCIYTLDSNGHCVASKGYSCCEDGIMKWLQDEV